MANKSTSLELKDRDEDRRAAARRAAARFGFSRGLAAEKGWGELTMYAVIRLAEEAASAPLRSAIFGRLPDSCTIGA